MKKLYLCSMEITSKGLCAACTIVCKDEIGLLQFPNPTSPCHE